MIIPSSFLFKKTIDTVPKINRGLEKKENVKTLLASSLLIKFLLYLILA